MTTVKSAGQSYDSVNTKAGGDIKGHDAKHAHAAHQRVAEEKEELEKLLKKMKSHGRSKQDLDELQQELENYLQNSKATHSDSAQVNASSDTEAADNIVEADGILATQGDMVLSGGISVLYTFMDLLSGIAQFKYLEMQQKAKVSRDAQNQANRVQEQIAFVSKQSDPDTHTVDLDKGVIKYMRENDIKIDGKTIDDYLGGDPKNPKQLDKGGLDAVKSALENASNRASDFVSQSQLQLQKVMQTYNVTVSLINSMQTMLEEMNKSIAQNIR